MVLGVAVIFTLSSLPLLILGGQSSNTFLVEVTIPQKEGRNEMEDITFIQTTLSDLAGIDVVFARKAFDNENVILVVKVQEICHWSSLTSDLSTQGYQVFVTPLQNCNDYAAELGVNVTYTTEEELQEFDILDFFQNIFYDLGKTTDDYIAMMEKYFEREKHLMEEGVKSVCYRVLGELPVRLIYFDMNSRAQLKHVLMKDRFEGKASVEMSLLQNFQTYKSTC